MVRPSFLFLPFLKNIRFLEEHLVKFFELSGQERVLAIIQNPRVFPEDILCNAAGIIATLSSNGIYSSPPPHQKEKG